MDKQQMEYHLSDLFLELDNISIATFIFNVVDDEWDRRVYAREIPEYSVVRTTLYESLVYRVFLGLSKILSENKAIIR